MSSLIEVYIATYKRYQDLSCGIVARKKGCFFYHFTDVKPLTKFVHTGSSFRDIVPLFQISTKKRGLF
jgi:hypothetical protein